jgi:hypothetical protein
MANDYTARCLSGAPTAANPAYYQQPGAYSQPYAYSQPAYIDPGAAAIVGAAVVGGVLDETVNGDYRGYRDPGYVGHTDRNSGGRW